MQNRLKDDKTALEKIEKYVTELHDLATTNEIPYLTVESLWMQSKLALFKFDVEESKKILTEAVQLATVKGLERLKNKLHEEQAAINNIIAQLINKGRESIPYPERLKIIGIETTIQEVKKHRILNIRDEEPILKKKMFFLKL